MSICCCVVLKNMKAVFSWLLILTDSLHSSSDWFWSLWLLTPWLFILSGCSWLNSLSSFSHTWMLWCLQPKSPFFSSFILRSEMMWSVISAGNKVELPPSFKLVVFSWEIEFQRSWIKYLSIYVWLPMVNKHLSKHYKFQSGERESVQEIDDRKVVSLVVGVGQWVRVKSQTKVTGGEGKWK